MRLLVTADLHFNHAGSRPRAIELIEQINQTGGDVLLVVGDTAVADGDWLEQCLGRFNFSGPKLIVAGNHELWTHRADSTEIFRNELPRRAAALGWHWLEDAPFVSGDVAVAGTIGWYDYSYAVPDLGIPRRFYQHKISPGAAEYRGLHPELFQPSADISNAARQIIARWNDGKFVKLHQSDEAFLEDRLQSLDRQLQSLAKVKTIVAASHHVPMVELLPPVRGAQWDFARAYLGSARIGDLIKRHENVSHIFCGHSHWPATATIGSITAANIGSSYRHKTFWAGDV